MKTNMRSTKGEHRALETGLPALRAIAAAGLIVVAVLQFGQLTAWADHSAVHVPDAIRILKEVSPVSASRSTMSLPADAIRILKESAAAPASSMSLPANAIRILKEGAAAPASSMSLPADAIRILKESAAAPASSMSLPGDAIRTLKEGAATSQPRVAARFGPPGR